LRSSAGRLVALLGAEWHLREPQPQSALPEELARNQYGRFLAFCPCLDVRQPFAGLGISRAEIDKLGVDRAGARRKTHLLEKLRELKVDLLVQWIEIDRFLKVLDRFVAALRYGGEAACQYCMVQHVLRRRLGALSQPDNRTRKVLRAQALVESPRNGYNDLL
jgi:hypothetical protein